MTVLEIMKDELPPHSPYNRERYYHLRKLESFQKKPSIAKAQGLEELGYCVDYDWISTGAEPKEYVNS